MSKKIASNPIMEKGIVEKYLGKMKVDPNHRFKSWEHCYYAFGDENRTIDELALHLAFYLASWGMYRGSCGILWKDYKIHTDAVNIINGFLSLRKEWLTRDDIPQTMKLYDELRKHYCEIKYYKPENISSLSLSATDTLITKIMLGTMGCVPAMDDLFKRGFGIYPSKMFDEKLLEQMIEYLERNKSDILQYQVLILNQIKCLYPPMKIVDMYFWQKGYDNYIEKKKLNKAAQ